MMTKKCDFNQQIADEICDQITTTSKGLRVLCKENKHWPSRAEIFRWIMKYPHFEDRYSRAKRHQIESLIDDVIEIADNTDKDVITDDKGRRVHDHEHINRSRLRVDKRKCIYSKLAPKIYGDKALLNAVEDKTKTLAEAIMQAKESRNAS